MNEYNKIAKDSWEKLGKWWDKQLGSGDYFHNNLIFPFLLDLVDPNPSDSILDLGCGNGALAMLFASKGATVCGVDFCEAFLSRAKKRAKELNTSIEFCLIDLTDEIQIQEKLVNKKFDKAVCSLAIHAISDLKPITKYLPAILKANGTITLVLLHPCFNSGEVQIRLPENYKNEDCGILRKSYIKSVVRIQKGKPLQPVPHPNFHRSLSSILNFFFSAGFVLDRCLEPTSEDNPKFLWSKLCEIPPLMILRFRCGDFTAPITELQN